MQSYDTKVQIAKQQAPCPSTVACQERHMVGGQRAAQGEQKKTSDTAPTTSHLRPTESSPKHSPKGCCHCNCYTSPAALIQHTPLSLSRPLSCVLNPALSLLSWCAHLTPHTSASLISLLSLGLDRRGRVGAPAAAAPPGPGPPAAAAAGAACD
mmetsp:Transcript_22868/g.58296  ORF Transcript_22868/g.58296 Transcript_22868/m.58296 type:complete len:154 (+) Transcript_22868:245-706(+)